MLLEIDSLTKIFDSKKVLENISFSIEKGEVFGLLGPNGAGKTTLIRIILDILKPDSGDVKVFGRGFSEDLKERIGYLPEESGIYRKVRLSECIRYFAALKGISDVDSRMDYWLDRMNLSDYREKKVQELSKGMNRKLQFIISVIHDPEILILDEPFYGLDPINKKLLKDILLELHEKGMTIIMSTHQMDEVERMCNRIAMISKGSLVLYGDLETIKKKYGYSVLVDYQGTLPELGGIKKIEDYGSYAEIIPDNAQDPQDILKSLVGNVNINRFEVKTRSLDDIFIEEAKE